MSTQLALPRAPQATPLRLPRSLTWLAAVGFSLALLIAAILSTHPRAFVGTAVLIGLTALFVVRPLYGTLAVLLIHQTVDLWADGQLETVGGLKFNMSTGLVLLIVVVGGAYLLENWQQVRTAPSIWPFIALVLIATISLAATPSLSLGIPEVLRLARIAVIYGLVYVLCRSREDIQLVIGAVLISALGVIVVAIEQTVSGDASGSLGQFQFDRANGGFTSPDELGIVLGVLLCFSIPLLLGGRLRWWPLLLAWIGLAGIALVGSYTRTGWIALIAGLLVIGAIRYRTLLLIVPLVLMAVVLAVPSTVNRFNDLSQEASHQGHYGNTFSERISLWKSNLPKVNHAPLIGHGFASIGVDQGRLTHSDYVRTVVETGMLGLTAFICLLLSGVVGSALALRRTLRVWPRGLLTAVSVGGVGVSVVYMLASADSNLLTKPVVTGAVWTLVALAHAAGRIAADESACSSTPAY
jgi:O-antigen ligase